MEGGQRLRSRSLVNGKQQDLRVSTSSGPALVTATEESPSIDNLKAEDEPDLAHSDATTNESTPPLTPVTATFGTTERVLRPRSSSLNLYKPLDTSKHKGKGKAEDGLAVANSRIELNRKTSWLAVPIPSSLEAVKPLGSESQSFGHGHGDSIPQALQSAGIVEQPGIYSLIQPIALLSAIFITSTVIIVVSISTVPTLAVPHDLSEVVQQGTALKRYSNGSLSTSLHVLAVLTLLFLYKQAFSIPGSLLTNILFGSLYGVFWSTLITSILTAVGSFFCYLMANKTSPLVRYYLPKPLAFLENQISSKASSSADLFSYLLLMRLFPLLPYAALNIAAGVLSVPPIPFFWTLVLGSIPYNLVTTQIGDILSSLPSSTTDLSSIWTVPLFGKLLLISVLSAAPILLKSRIQNWLGGANAQSGHHEYREPIDQQTWSEDESLQNRENIQLKHLSRRMASIDDSSLHANNEMERPVKAR